MAETMIKAGKIKILVNRSKEYTKSVNPLICMVILCGISGIMPSSGSSGGVFQHDQKRENVITLISLRHEKN
jgi:hypothetical protein